MQKRYIILLLLVSFAVFNIQAQNSPENSFHTNFVFKNGTQAVMFSNNVHLRAAPDATSESLMTISINSKVNIIGSIGSIKQSYDGGSSHWCRISFNKKIGYVLSGALSIAHKSQEDIHCLIAERKNGDNIKLKIRLYAPSRKTFSESEMEFKGSNLGFWVNLFVSKGIEGIQNIISISYMPESCGANTGGACMFYDGEKLIYIKDAYSASDIATYYSERLIYYNDDQQSDQIIQLKLESVCDPANESIEFRGKLFVEPEMTDRDKMVEFDEKKSFPSSLHWQDGKVNPDPDKIRELLK